MATPNLNSLMKTLGLVKKPPTKLVSNTATFQPQNPQQVLTLPAYREHLNSLYDNRTIKTSQALLQDLFKDDPDLSAAVGSYLTLSDTPMTMLVHDIEGKIDPNATAELYKMVRLLTATTDYSRGFTMTLSMRILCQELRYMLMLRGAIGAELVFDKMMIPYKLQQIDMASIRWYEKASGEYKPRQAVSGSTDGIDLDIPSFFVAYHRRDPTKIYPGSDFLASINTIAARQQVINDLYRIMQVTGFPRISLKVVEEVLMKSAPADVRDNPEVLANWANTQLGAVAASFGTLRADQAFAHFDSVEPSIINEKAPGSSLEINNVVDVLNAQNQAALKTMATVIGRGNGSVQVASAEVRLAAMNADQLNVPIEQLFDQVFTFMINVYGIPGFVSTKFASAELRPDLELEPQKLLRQSRLQNDLSLGVITDEEYHLQMYNRLPPPGAPQLSGTGFMVANKASVDATNISPNGDSLDRSLVPQGSGNKAVKSNSVKSGG